MDGQVFIQQLQEKHEFEIASSDEKMNFADKKILKRCS